MKGSDESCSNRSFRVSLLHLHSLIPAESQFLASSAVQQQFQWMEKVSSLFSLCSIFESSLTCETCLFTIALLGGALLEFRLCVFCGRRRRKENKSARMKCETLCGVSDANTEHNNNKLMHQQRFCFDLLVWPLWNAVGKKRILFSVLLCYRQVFWFTYSKSFCSRELKSPSKRN